MSVTGRELAALFHRDLTRLVQQLDAFPSDALLWQTLPGISNSAGNLILHLEGNQREYIGRQLGALPYARTRPKEFTDRGLTRSDLRARIAPLPDLISGILASLSDATLDAYYAARDPHHPEPTRQFLFHLYGHLNYHIGQIDYLRRALTGQGALDLAQL